MYFCRTIIQNLSSPKTNAEMRTFRLLTQKCNVMKYIIDSQLIGKWYQIARTFSHHEKSVAETMLYISPNSEDIKELLYVGIKEDRSKVLKKISLKTFCKNDSVFVVFRKGLFRKTLEILTFDADEGVVVLSDKKMKYVSILSRKSEMSQKVVEGYLSKIRFMKEKVKLYSNAIV